MPEHPDLVRLRNEYADRAQHVDKTNLYSLFNPAQLFNIQQRQRVVLKCLQRNNLYHLNEQRILEIGCGNGNVLLDFFSCGAQLKNLYGIDLLVPRLLQARNRAPSLSISCADGQSLPFPSQHFDILLQFTAFSSILDETVRKNVSFEMQRVLKSQGLILWYDFWWNPANRQTRGIRPNEIRRLFPDCKYHFERITLAPPLVRKLATHSWGLCLFLESLKVFNTHYLVAIRPNA